MLEYRRRHIYAGSGRGDVLMALRTYFEPDALDRINQRVTTLLQKKRTGQTMEVTFLNSMYRAESLGRER